MNELLQDVARYGALLIFLSVLVEQLGLPIPAVPTLVVAGALVAEGRLSGRNVFLAACLGSLLADSFWFALGWRHGTKILRFLCRLSLSPDTCVRETEGYFEKWGHRSLLVAKFLPGFSTVAPPLAGAARSGVGRFLLFTTGGTVLWVGSALAIGIVFHATVGKALELLARLGALAVVLAAAALGAYVGARWWRRRLFIRRFLVARIHPSELADRMRQGESPLVVDVRSDVARKRDPRSLPGALVMRSRSFEEVLASLPLDREIVLYCT